MAARVIDPSLDVLITDCSIVSVAPHSHSQALISS